MFGSANTAHFTLQIPSVRNDFKVLAFDGSESISALYAIKVELVSEYPDFDLESLLSQPAFLQFGLNGEGIHGRIEDVSMGETGKRLTSYHLTPDAGVALLAVQPRPAGFPEPEGAADRGAGANLRYYIT